MRELGIPDLVLRSLALGLLFGVAILVADQAASAVRETSDRIGTELGRLLPKPVVERERPSAQPVAPNTAPVLDPFERVTRVARFPMSGRVPSFALAGPPPRIEIRVNGGIAATVPIDPASGHFSATVTLANGANAIVVAALRGDERAEALPRVVTLDTVAPTLVIARPAESATLEGPSIVVDGRTEAGASVSVNGHGVSVSADGLFADSFQASAGPLAIDVIARDDAGNETKQTLRVTVEQGTQAGSLGVSIALSATKAKPGTTVNADVTITEDARPVRGATVAVNVGLVRIATGQTDSTGRYRATFSAPATEGFVQVIVLATRSGAAGQSAATLEVAR